MPQSNVFKVKIHYQEGLTYLSFVLVRHVIAQTDTIARETAIKEGEKYLKENELSDRREIVEYCEVEFICTAILANPQGEND